MAKKRAVVKKSLKRKLNKSYSIGHYTHENNSFLLILAGVVVIILCLYLVGIMKFNKFNARQYIPGSQMFHNNVQYNVNQENVNPSPSKDSLQHP